MSSTEQLVIALRDAGLPAVRKRIARELKTRVIELEAALAAATEVAKKPPAKKRSATSKKG